MAGSAQSTRPCKIGADPTRYAKDFFDVTLGNNGVHMAIPKAIFGTKR